MSDLNPNHFHNLEYEEPIDSSRVVIRLRQPSLDDLRAQNASPALSCTGVYVRSRAAAPAPEYRPSSHLATSFSMLSDMDKSSHFAAYSGPAATAPTDATTTVSSDHDWEDRWAPSPPPGYTLCDEEEIVYMQEERMGKAKEELDRLIAEVRQRQPGQFPSSVAAGAPTYNVQSSVNNATATSSKLQVPASTTSSTTSSKAHPNEPPTQPSVNTVDHKTPTAGNTVKMQEVTSSTIAKNTTKAPTRALPTPPVLTSSKVVECPPAGSSQPSKVVGSADQSPNAKKPAMAIAGASQAPQNAGAPAPVANFVCSNKVPLNTTTVVPISKSATMPPNAKKAAPPLKPLAAPSGISLSRPFEKDIPPVRPQQVTQNDKSSSTTTLAKAPIFTQESLDDSMAQHFLSPSMHENLQEVNSTPEEEQGPRKSTMLFSVSKVIVGFKNSLAVSRKSLPAASKSISVPPVDTGKEKVKSPSAASIFRRGSKAKSASTPATDDKELASAKSPSRASTFSVDSVASSPQEKKVKMSLFRKSSNTRPPSIRSIATTLADAEKPKGKASGRPPSVKSIFMPRAEPTTSIFTTSGTRPGRPPSITSQCPSITSTKSAVRKPRRKPPPVFDPTEMGHPALRAPRHLRHSASFSGFTYQSR